VPNQTSKSNVAESVAKFGIACALTAIGDRSQDETGISSFVTDPRACVAGFLTGIDLACVSDEIVEAVFNLSRLLDVPEERISEVKKVISVIKADFKAEQSKEKSNVRFL
jgi:hypothetical protein